MAKKKRNKAYRPKVTTTPQDSTPTVTPAPRASLLRRLGALSYDILLVAALVVIAGAIGVLVTLLLNGAGVIDISQHADVAAYLTQQPIYIAYIWIVGLSFYVWFWMHGGQTIGMRAWRLQVRQLNGKPLTLIQSLIRLGSACLGLGNLMVPFSKQGHAFQDLWADCEVIVLTKEENKLKNVIAK